jgi:hypothetical protein
MRILSPGFGKVVNKCTSFGRIKVCITVIRPIGVSCLLLHCLSKDFISMIFFSKLNLIKEVLFKDYTNGGLKMINLTAFINLLKSTWIRRTIHSEKIKHNMESNHVDLELLTTAGDKYY